MALSVTSALLGSWRQNVRDIHEDVAAGAGRVAATRRGAGRRRGTRFGAGTGSNFAGSAR